MTEDIEHIRCANKWFDHYFGIPDKSQNLAFKEDYEMLLRDIGTHIGAHNPNLEEFMKRGGKIISYSGAADVSVPFGDMLKYYNRVCERLGGFEKVSEFFRHFTLPDKAHGNNGRGANACFGDDENQSLLDRLREWCVTGAAPEHLTVAREIYEDGVKIGYGFIRQVYPYRADMVEGKDFPKTTDDKFLDIPQRKD